MDWLKLHTDTIGFWAGFCTAASFAPQVVQSWRTGGKGLSWGMLGLFGAGVTLWFTYGFLLDAWPVMVANAATAVEILCLIYLKLKRR